MLSISILGQSIRDFAPTLNGPPLVDGGFGSLGLVGLVGQIPIYKKISKQNGCFWIKNLDPLIFPFPFPFYFPSPNPYPNTAYDDSISRNLWESNLIPAQESIPWPI